MIMKSLAIALTLAAAPLAADCFAWEIGTRMGYRWDDLEHTLFQNDNPSQPTFKEDFDNLSTAQISGFTKFRLWWFEAGVDADYGWTVGGHVKTKSFVDIGQFGIVAPTFKSCASGEVWDAFFTGGIRVPFYDYCDQGLFITPLGGYSFHGIREKHRNLRPSSINVGPSGDMPADPTFVSLPDTDQLKRDYKGPFAGVSMSILYCRFYTTFGYAYHWIDLDQKLGYTREIEFFNPNGIATIQFAISNSFKPDRNRGNRGWISLNYQDPCGWRVGLYGTYFSVSTSKKSSRSSAEFILTVEQSSSPETLLVTNPAKASWRTFTVMLESAYEF